MRLPYKSRSAKYARDYLPRQLINGNRCLQIHSTELTKGAAANGSGYSDGKRTDRKTKRAGITTGPKLLQFVTAV
jgi:hypothetical protein